jgi:phospholipid N-methyltransferase
VAKKKAAVASAEQQAAVELVRLAQEQGLSLTGPDGLLKQLTKRPVERALEAEMAEHLQGNFPHATVLQADAFNLPIERLKQVSTEIETVICGIPLVLLGEKKQRQFIEQVEAVAPGRGFLLYTYCITSPLPYRALNLEARRLAWTPLNFPPASVWHYLPKS